MTDEGESPMTPKTDEDYNKECPPTPQNTKTPFSFNKKKNQNKLFVEENPRKKNWRRKKSRKMFDDFDDIDDMNQYSDNPPRDQNRQENNFFSPVKKGYGNYNRKIRNLDTPVKRNIFEDDEDDTFEDENMTDDLDHGEFNTTTNSDSPYNDEVQVPFVMESYHTRESKDNPFSPDKRIFNNSNGRSYSSTGYNTPHNLSTNSVSSFPPSTNKKTKVLPYFSRYRNDFEEICNIGGGSFGRVTKCKNRFDGMYYAIKMNNKMIKGDRHVMSVLREVHALATLVDNPYIVRYYSAWIEQSRLFIQTELCEGGSLSDKFKQKMRFTEGQLLEIIKQVSSGLHLMHAQNLVHLDIKPDNLFQNGKNYKIGDLGLVASSLEFDRDLLDGDCRYIAKEVLEYNESTPNLKSADVFALGATILELASGQPLPKNGKSWNRLREGKIPYIQGYSNDFQNLVKAMLHYNPNKRPNTAQILHHKLILKKTPSFDHLVHRNFKLEEILLQNSKVEESLRREIELLKSENNKLIGMQDILSSSI